MTSPLENDERRQRWHRVTEIFHAAMARESGQRAQHAPDPIIAARAEVAPGKDLGRYRIEGLIGAGGMGDVYRARDVELGRDVAIKVLPAEFTADRERLARFEREARILASLNHPNIAAIYGIDRVDDARALILELVEGETLDDRLYPHTPSSSGAQGIHRAGIEIPRALAIARQIAEALEAAHEKGIVHRDLKPTNIKITPAGVV